MRQTAVSFGPQKAIVGVYTEPDTQWPDVPVMLLFNAGLLPRQGPHRINVRIARELAAIGMASLRFDLSGLGDSQAIGSESGNRAQSVRDLQAAMDFLEQSYGTRRFLAFGVCSGAVIVFDLAQADSRVASILMFDGFWYRSRWTMPIRHLKRLRAMGFRGALEAVQRRLRGTQRPSEAAAEVPQIFADYQGNPPIETYVEVMQRLVDQGVDVQIVYGGSFTDYYSYSSQYKHVFQAYPFYSRMKCQYEPDIDHTFITKRSQQGILDVIRRWGKTHMPSASVP